MAASLWDHVVNAACGCEITLDVETETPLRCTCGDYCYCYDYTNDPVVSSVYISLPCKEHNGKSD